MVYIFDSHPVQYKAPVYQRIQELRPGSICVVYASDCSLRGFKDGEFGATVTWDVPLLSGYKSVILQNERGVPLSGYSSLTGRGIYQLLRKNRPSAVLISQFLYESDLVTVLSCVWLGIPIWIRHETQDEAFHRRPLRRVARNLAYRIIYRFVRHAFYPGILNREHLLRHGMAPERMSFSPYCTVSLASSMTHETKSKRRDVLREELGVGAAETLVLFSGKLIEKKNPQLILEALQRLKVEERNRFKVVFVGSGVLEGPLREMASSMPGHVSFAGFVNQSQISDYYLAADILVLPSRRAGETWGLVVNEALQAGCAVIITEAVGCHREFEGWSRVRVIRVGDAEGCAQGLQQLSTLERSFEWCEELMKTYSIDAAATAIVRQIDKVAGAEASF